MAISLCTTLFLTALPRRVFIFYLFIFFTFISFFFFTFYYDSISVSPLFAEINRRAHSIPRILLPAVRVVPLYCTSTVQYYTTIFQSKNTSHRYLDLTVIFIVRGSEVSSYSFIIFYFRRRSRTLFQKGNTWTGVYLQKQRTAIVVHQDV